MSQFPLEIRPAVAELYRVLRGAQMNPRPLGAGLVRMVQMASDAAMHLSTREAKARINEAISAIAKEHNLFKEED